MPVHLSKGKAAAIIKVDFDAFTLAGCQVNSILTISNIQLLAGFTQTITVANALTVNGNASTANIQSGTIFVTIGRYPVRANDSS